ncbi:hypothetical protein ADH76_30680 [Enterocloster clostridioformis]|uniref:hypothetical protein n=1 Tax=Enterocloster clostridioformis TaxID=1531 RepID=UPI00080C8604|nr:hypothetical protein [Enterocloster clostridioformis]ANU47078.1 hypothetical protein A4V08_15995 [Lachnoclostridium sp. YL32]OXE62921.1 hypothetical protein ADH76_30680 [Enterocloster clostridioformis]
MVDIAAPVFVQLKNKAAESGRSYQLCLQFCDKEELKPFPATVDGADFNVKWSTMTNKWN